MTTGDISVIISAAAVTISVSTFAASRWRDRRDLFLRVHERLVTTEQQNARRLLHQLREQGKSVEDYTDEEYALVNNALAALNVLGIYYRLRPQHQRPRTAPPLPPRARTAAGRDICINMSAPRGARHKHGSWQEAVSLDWYLQPALALGA